jgi:tRNA(adenine34) deaminase
MPSDQDFLDAAFLEATIAESKGEVPIGAVLVRNNEIIARAHNLKETLKDCTAHAEFLVIQDAQKKTGDWRLTDCALYSSLEPCVMCAGIILHARISRVVFAAMDLKWGAGGSKVNLLDQTLFNHRCAITYLENKTYQTQLTQFFKQLRKTEK